MPKPKGVKTPKLFKLTRATYYDPKRPHISNSQVSDYLVSPSYFHKRHITKDIPNSEPTPSMKVGSLVDSFIDGSPTKFEIKTLAKDDPDAYKRQKDLPPEYLISESDYLKAFELAVALKASPLFPNLIHCEYQVPLASEKFNIPICGLLDILYQDPQTKLWTIYDVKTTAPGHVRDHSSWLRTCDDFGYLRQLAHYGRLLSDSKCIPFDQITFRHLVVSMVEDHFPKVYGFEYSAKALLPHLQVFDDAISKIAKQEFTDPTPSFLLCA